MTYAVFELRVASSELALRPTEVDVFILGRFLVAVPIALALVLMGCSDGDDDRRQAATSFKGAPFIIVNGTEYACEDTTDIECSPKVQAAFDRWGRSIDRYADSDRLVHIGRKFTDQKLVHAGITACDMAKDGHEYRNYSRYMSRQIPNTPPQRFYPLWQAAGEVVCPAVFANRP